MIEEPIDTESSRKFTEGSGDGVALRDYRPLARKYKADKLLLVSATSLGTVRSYYGFLPLTPPTALYLPDRTAGGPVDQQARMV